MARRKLSRVLSGGVRPIRPNWRAYIWASVAVSISCRVLGSNSLIKNDITDNKIVFHIDLWVGETGIFEAKVSDLLFYRLI